MSGMLLKDCLTSSSTTFLTDARRVDPYNGRVVAAPLVGDEEPLVSVDFDLPAHQEDLVRGRFWTPNIGNG